MHALMAGEVQRTVSRPSAFSFATTRPQAEQARGENLADFGALGSGHQVRVEGVRSGHWSAS
jgi:hypothetical protein